MTNDIKCANSYSPITITYYSHVYTYIKFKIGNVVYQNEQRKNIYNLLH